MFGRTKPSRRAAPLKRTGASLRESSSRRSTALTRRERMGAVGLCPSVFETSGVAHLIWVQIPVYSMITGTYASIVTHG